LLSRLTRNMHAALEARQRLKGMVCKAIDCQIS